MSDKPSSFKFAQIIPAGTVAIICGIGAIRLLFQYPIIAFLVGTIGMVVGVITLRMQVEKLDKVCAVIGIALSIAPMIYVMVIFTQK